MPGRTCAIARDIGRKNSNKSPLDCLTLHDGWNSRATPLRGDLRLFRDLAPQARSLWHVAGDTLDDILIAAAQLDDIAIRIADEDRDLSTFTEADRSLCDRDIVRL